MKGEQTMSLKIDYREVMSRIQDDVNYVADEAYSKGYKIGKQSCSSKIGEESYQRGLDEAWEAARKIVLNPDEGGTSLPDLFAMFGGGSMQSVFRKYSASQAIAKLKAYEEKQKADNKFEFGDEIIDLHGAKGCVISKDNEGLDTMYALFDDCRVPQHVTQSNYRKTGKHFNIDKILEELRA